MSLRHEKLQERSGNYVLTIGFPSAGKTVLQSWLTRYIMTQGPFRSELDNVGDSSTSADFDMNRVVNTWMDQWSDGRFPEPTPVGEDEIREIKLKVTPLYGVKSPLEFGFLEISGEMMQSVIPGETENPSLSRVLLEFLRNSNIKLVIVMLIDPASDDNDRLFFNLMNFLDANLSYNIRDKASLALVASKPDVALDRLRAHNRKYAAHADLTGEVLEDYISFAVPSMYKEYYDWPKKRKVLSRFHIGDVEMDEQGPKVAYPSYVSAENLFGWIYLQFKGHRLGYGPMGRFWRWIRQ